MNKGERVILLDMDGVLTNFVKAVAGYASQNRDSDHFHNPPPDWGVEKHFGWETQSDMWDTLHAQGAAFWSNLEPLPWARMLFNTLHDTTSCRVVICTSPSVDPSAAGGKVQWLQDFFCNRFFRDFMITPRKAAAAGPLTFLIDDSMRHVQQFRARGGGACLWPMPWNEAGAEHYSRSGTTQLSYVLGKIQQWRGGTATVHKAPLR